MCSQGLDKSKPRNNIDIETEFDDEPTFMSNHSTNPPAILSASTNNAMEGSSLSNASSPILMAGSGPRASETREMLESMGISGLSTRIYPESEQNNLDIGSEKRKNDILSVINIAQDALTLSTDAPAQADQSMPIHVSSQRHAAKDILRTDSDDADIVENIDQANSQSQIDASIPGPRDQLSFAAPNYQRHMNGKETPLMPMNSTHSITDTRTMESSITRAIQEVKNGIVSMDNKLPKSTPEFDRINIAGESVRDLERRQVSRKFLDCLRLRREFVWMPKPKKENLDWHNIRDTPDYKAPYYDPSMSFPTRSPHRYMFVNGCAQVFPISEDSAELAKPFEYAGTPEDSPVDNAIYAAPVWTDFCDALSFIVSVGTNGPCKSWSHTRLTILETQKRMHSLMNHDVELSQSKAVPHRDFYNVRKIDNHVHHSACMNQKHLLRYIKKKIREESAKTVPVLHRGDKTLTLQEVFESLNLSAYDLSIDTLDMHAGQTFQRFDKFNLKYNPIGETALREIFLKYNNHIRGQYLAEVTQEVFNDLEANKYQFAEYRISIYGRQEDEWDKLADWIIDYGLFSHNVRWMIQIPRLYSVYRKIGQISCLQDMLTNIFRPLFEVSIDPSTHPKLHVLLENLVGFDCVDDESIRTRFFDARDPAPAEWTSEDDPHYCSFLYYLYANLYSLNQLREARGFKTFALRPHAGEAGDIEHIASSFLIAHSINHGLTLFKSPPLQYLYYLCQSGISLSPLSNNLLFLEYQKNPFPKYFARGLNVALSTDDPLMIHVTKEPLVEEFSVASQVWKLSSIDMCEIARNSVYQSGFEHRYKCHWLGNNYWNRDINGNDIRCTNVPDIRVQFRFELLHREHSILASLADEPLNMGLIDPRF